MISTPLSSWPGSAVNRFRGSPVLARALKRIYREPVYALGILPAPEEGRLYSYNAARSLSTLVNEVDNTFLFDNSAWKNEGESIKSAYQRLNDEIVRRFGVLFRAGEVTKMGVGEMVVDSSEIINTLRGGGISSVGYAITEVVSRCTKQQKGIFGGLKDTISRTASGKKEGSEEVLLGEDKSAKIIALVRRAMLGRLTLPCDYSSAERALVLIAGPRRRWTARGSRSPRAGWRRISPGSRSGGRLPGRLQLYRRRRRSRDGGERAEDPGVPGDCKRDEGGCREGEGEAGLPL